LTTKRAICLLFALGLATSVAAETKTRYLVGTRRPVRAAGLGFMRDTAEATARQVRTYTNFNDIIAVDLTADEAAALKRSGDVRHVNPVMPVYILGERAALTPAVSEKLKQQVVPYGIDTIRARAVWTAGRGAAGNINVAIVDTGIDYNHPDLKPRYAGGYNVVQPSKPTNDPLDDHGHGTHVAGTIAAMDNEFGVVGVAPEARIWAVKVLGNQGSGTDETLIAGMDWVISKKREIGGNWIANFSLGSSAGNDASREVFHRAMDEGIILVAAAGNSSAERISFPALEQGVLAISAIDDKDEMASFSNFGRGIAFAAPGVRVLSTVPLGTVESTELQVNGNEFVDAVPLEGSARGEVTSITAFCGYGAPEDFPVDVAGKIALIKRSPPSPPDCSVPNSCFRDKVRNAVARGAVAVVILPDERPDRRWGLLGGDPQAKFPVVVAIREFADAQRLAAAAGQQMSVSTRGEDYTYFSGTSMATPHVVGALALAWSLAPTATPEQVKIAAKLTAHDLGQAGYDKEFGYGRIDALATAHYLAPGLFGVPPPTPLPPRRRPGH
jgi:serine protease